MNNNYWCGDDSPKQEDGVNHIDSGIMSVSNHVYFYSEVGPSSILELNKLLQLKVNELLKASIDMGNGKPTIYLHINSGGGAIFDGVAGMDTIIKLKKDVDIISVVDGKCASAATFLSLVATKRIIHKHSYMLIHQLTGSVWGKYRELEDAQKNWNEFMRMVKEVYKEYTKVPMKDIEEILEHDIWWDSKRCLEMGLVDEIWD